MEQLRSFFANQNTQKYLAIGLVLFILIALPLTIFEVKQQQTVNQHASTGRFWNGLPDSCNHLSFNIPSENPTCTNGGASKGYANQPNQSSYTTTFRMYWDPTGTTQSTSPTITFTEHKYYCPQGGGCTTGDTPVTKQVVIDGQNSAHWLADLPVSFSSQNGACGSVQIDLEFQYDFGGQHCFSLTSTRQPGGFAGFGYCQFWSHTDTNGTPVVACMPSVTPTATVTPADTITPTDTPTETVTPTDTPTPSDTPTPALTVTPTDTPNPSDTPTDTPTPIFATATPRPTLPPTGPGNTFVSAGLIGVAIAVFGLVLAIGF